jgi:pyruvate ferredoxin oxidoreductase alpha subunit
MTKKVIEGSHAIAEAVKLCEPSVVAAYPITPQTHIIERIAEMVADGEMRAKYVNVESEHSAMSVCLGAQATGVRTFTASCSQGLALMYEMLYIVSGMRLPIVMAVANRALSAPLNIWNDWSDSFGAKDSGWIQLYCESAQEAFDTVVQAYKIAEDSKVSLPVMVCIDGFFLSHVYEPVEISDAKLVKKFLPRFSGPVLDFDKPVTQGMWAGPDHYQDFRIQQQDAMQNALSVIRATNDEFKRTFGRGYGNGLIETFNMENAKYALVTMGSLAGTAKHVIRENGLKDVGLIRIKSFRPFPAAELEKAMANVKAIGVLEKDLTPGLGGALYHEVSSLTKKNVSSFVGGLGGKDVKIEDFLRIFKDIRSEKKGLTWV